MQVDLNQEQLDEAQVYLRAMASALEGVDQTTDEEHRRSAWVSYFELEGKLHGLIPPFGSSPADPGPYTFDG